MKTKILTKITSGILCAALTMQLGWAATTESVSAATASIDITESGDIGYVVSITSTGCIFHIKAFEGGYNITCQDDSTVHESVDSIGRLVINGSSVVYLQSSLEAEIEITQSGSQLDVSNSILTCKNLSGTGALVNDGRIVFDTFNPNDFPNISLLNAGTIVADNMNLTQSSNLRTDSYATYKVQDEFIKGSDDLKT